MHCPFCGYLDQKVLDSRPGADGESIRRRRECISCGKRFTTYERFDRPRLFAIKRDGSREELDRNKIFESMRVACGKRPVATDTLRQAAARIERDLFHEFEDEVSTREIGNRVMRELANIDTVGYVRFASVYKEFETVADFAAMVETVQREEALAPFRSLQESLL
ncbi:MAG TPA: transcriptional regulator NrdR [Fimbriimonas sp.]|nr:transcriptional regulator NrdR [Fimbriimonas sp.]